MCKYWVVVGNIGTVLITGSEIAAIDCFIQWQQASIDNVGRAAGEDVTMLYGEDIVREYTGTLNNSEE